MQPFGWARSAASGIRGAWQWFAAPVITPATHAVGRVLGPPFRWFGVTIVRPGTRAFAERAAWTWPAGHRHATVRLGLIGGAVALALTVVVPVHFVESLRDRPPPVPGGFPDACPGFGAKAEKGLTPDAVLVLRCVHAQFPSLTDFGGNYAAGKGSDHNTGRAVDTMIPHWQTQAGNTQGWQVAYWEQQWATQLGITYLIFDDHIWSVQRRAEGWRKYSNPYGAGGASGRHLNHVHTSVKGNAATISR